MSKEQAFKQIGAKIDVAQKALIESMELIYNAGYTDGLNDALDSAIKLTEHSGYADEIRRLKQP